MSFCRKWNGGSEPSVWRFGVVHLSFCFQVRLFACADGASTSQQLDALLQTLKPKRLVKMRWQEALAESEAAALRDDAGLPSSRQRKVEEGTHCLVIGPSSAPHSKGLHEVHFTLPRGEASVELSARFLQQSLSAGVYIQPRQSQQLAEAPGAESATFGSLAARSTRPRALGVVRVRPVATAVEGDLEKQNKNDGSSKTWCVSSRERQRCGVWPALRILLAALAFPPQEPIVETAKSFSGERVRRILAEAVAQASLASEDSGRNRDFRGGSPGDGVRRGAPCESLQQRRGVKRVECKTAVALRGRTRGARRRRAVRHRSALSRTAEPASASARRDAGRPRGFSRRKRGTFQGERSALPKAAEETQSARRKSQGQRSKPTRSRGSVSAQEQVSPAEGGGSRWVLRGDLHPSVFLLRRLMQQQRNALQGV